jgi:acetylornithine/N-succinyldiaminopimelate aminotransferase
MGVYNRAPLAFERGRGARLFSTTGEEYLDCVAGIATCGLGHAHPVLVEALKTQGEKLWHVSNIYTIPEQEVLADKLCAATFADVVFFTNSGTEAIECALKAARRYHVVNGQPERVDIIGFDGSFHGRSYAAVNASGNAGYLDGFGPRLPGYVQLPFGDWDALKAAIGPTTAGVIIEPVQGEGGARALSDAQLNELRQITRDAGVLLIFDEVQSGMGRTGKLFAHEWASDAAPDIMAVAKALGGGFPVGACLASTEGARGMTPGVHGSTYGGNPLAMAVGKAAFDAINTPRSWTTSRPGRRLLHPAAERPEGPLPGRHRRHPRQGPADRHQAGPEQSRVHGPGPRREAADRRRRRQLRAPAAAAEPDGRGSLRGHRQARKGLRGRPGQSGRLKRRDRSNRSFRQGRGGRQGDLQ